MKIFKQDYSLKRKQEMGANFSDFASAYHRFDMPPVSDRLKISQQFIEMIYNNTNADVITFAHGPNDNHSIYAGKVRLAKINGEKLIYLWMPDLEKYSISTKFLKSMGTQYLTFVGFPNLVHAGNEFLCEARDLQHLYAPNMKDTGIDFLRYSQIKHIKLPSVMKLGEDSLRNNEECIKFDAPNMREFGPGVFYSNIRLDVDKGYINTPKLTKIGPDCAEVFYYVCHRNNSSRRNRSR